MFLFQICIPTGREIFAGADQTGGGSTENHPRNQLTKSAGKIREVTVSGDQQKVSILFFGSSQRKTNSGHTIYM
jgi:hypothetical protein